MTQPPPPPNQPPGPPPNQPPAGGYGAPPPQPPQNPAYGHPQAPQPGQGPGYGYPQTPPPAPAQNPAYGYPTQPMQPQPVQPQPVPPPSGGNGGGLFNRTQWQIIAAAAVAIVLIIGGGVGYSVVKGDDTKNEAKNSTGGTSGGAKDGPAAADGPGKEKAPAKVASKVAFQLPEPDRDDLMAVYGSWVTDKAYVKPGANSVVGYDVAKGTPLWTTDLPGQVCGGSRHVTEDNKTAILFEATKRKAPKFYEKCTEVGVIDLNTGKLLWSTSVKGDGDQKAEFTEVTLSGNTVAAGGGLRGGGAFNLKTGAVLWKPKVDAQQCRDLGYGGGKALVAVRTCGEYGDQTTTIQPLNPDNGTPLSSFKMPAGVEDARIVSSDPLVVAADVGDTGTFGISDFFSVDAKTGTQLAKISAPGDTYEARCAASDGVEGCQFVVVGNGRLYLPTAQRFDERTNEIVSFDLATGKATSGRADAGKGYTSLPLRMDGGNIIAYKTGPYNKGGQVVSINGATFKQTVLMENPGERAIRDVESGFTTSGSEFRYAAGRLFISERLLGKPRDDDPSFGKKYLAVAFSTAD
ncbi:PQQ-binding-like beta-propeller repeat protein [Streptomyces sp. NPDC006208]|uniref:outer membrane protein assembly factor BamB family protein n=1 Tax=Streptomyces sp. NPDC006208 TaxID=3156734 RepID=UPI0033AC4F79